MRVVARQRIEVEIDPLEVIEKLLGNYYIQNGEVKEEVGYRNFTVTANISEEDKNYYMSLWNIKEYLKSKK